MKQILSIPPLSFLSFYLYGQTTYNGYIDKYPIELVTFIYSDGDARAIYAYSNYDEPIIIDGRLQQNKLTLFEKKGGKTQATLTFEDFNAKTDKLEGNWTDLKTGKQLKITLEKRYGVDCDDTAAWKGREILQPVSLGNKYFKLILSKEKEDCARVTGIKILEKKTDRLIQQIDLDCQLLALDNVSTGDFNFDGIKDFSVFESSYAGSNTSSLYFLYDSTTKKYFNSGFTGTSLEFDSKSKTIFERNECCGGTSVTTAEYNVVKNKMVLIKQHCYKWDEKKQELVERKMKDCQ